LTEAEISSLVEEIDRSGYAVLAQYVTTEDINHLRHFVREAVAAAGNSYTSLDGYAPVANTALGRIADSSVLKQVCMRVYERVTSRPAPYPTYYQILRCLTGETKGKHTRWFSTLILICLRCLSPSTCPPARKTVNFSCRMFGQLDGGTPAI
jgi:hypothetical protein